MEDKPKFLQFGKSTDQPIVAGKRTITPEAWVLSLNTPFGGFVWNRPTAVLLETDGVTERVEIMDPTRLALMAIWGLGAVIVALGWAYGRRAHK